jgi:hypothetical protein
MFRGKKKRIESREEKKLVGRMRTKMKKFLFLLFQEEGKEISKLASFEFESIDSRINY